MRKLRFGFIFMMVVCMTVSLFALTGYASTEYTVDIDLCADDYGYNYLGTMDKGEARQQLYSAIDEVVRKFHTDTTLDADHNYLVGDVEYVSLGLTFDEAIEVWNTYRNDHPLYYWMSNTLTYNEMFVGLYTTAEYANGADRAVYNDLIAAGIEEYTSIVEGETNAYRIALAYHDAIINAIDYAYEEDGVTPEDEPWAHNILGVFEKHSGVCESYARTFQLLLNVSGVDNIFVTGTAGDEDHAWNLVQLDDGNWYWCDLTWNDAPGWMWGIKYNHFCVNDTQDINWSDGGWDGNHIGFTDKHSANLSTDTGIDFLYTLPERSSAEYEPVDGEMLLRDTFTVDNMSFVVVGYNTVQITRIDVVGHAAIPETVEYNGVTYTVISIGNISEDGLLGEPGEHVVRDNVTSLFIPETVCFIWDGAFDTSLFTIESITVDENNPYFTSLDGVLFTKSLYTLIAYPLGNNRTEYIIPDATVYVAYHAFGNRPASAYGCALTSITLGKGVACLNVTNWGEGYHDSAPKPSIPGLPAIVNTVSGGFASMYNILSGDKQLLVDDDNLYYHDEEGIIYNKEKTIIEFISNKDIVDFNIPDTVCGIEDHAFAGCHKLKSMIIPKKIASVVFGNYFALHGLFENCTGLETVNVQANIDVVGMTMFLGCTSLKKVILPNTVTKISNLSFGQCSNLEVLFLPKNVSSISENSFWECSSLKDIYFYGTVPAMENGVFDNVSSDFTIHYLKGTYGWTTPTWTDPYGNVYNTKPFTLNDVSGKVIGASAIDGEATVKLMYKDVVFAETQTVNGSYLLEDIPSGEYTLTVSKDGYAIYCALITVENGDLTLADIVLSEGYSIKGNVSVIGTVTEPIELYLYFGEVKIASAEIIDGKYCFNNIESGSYTLRVDDDGFCPFILDVTVFNAAVELVDVEIIKKVTLSGKISNANDNYRIMLWQNGIEGTFISQCFITEDKTFCLENIVPGIYTIDISKDGSIYYLNEIELNSNINLEVTLCLSGHGEFILSGAITPTCATPGYTGDWICNICGSYDSIGSVIPATGEHVGEWALDTLPELGVPGLEVYICDTCNTAVDQRVIPALTADFAEDVGDLRDVVLTEDEKQQVDAGSVLQVELKSEDISETVSQTEKDLIAEKVSAENIGIYLDIDLIKYIGNSDPIPVTETSAPIKVTVAVPEAMLGEGVTYQIARIHDGIVDIIDGIFDPETKTFTFETDKFSTYVLIVKEESAGILGDVNGDTIVNSDDAVAILRHLAGYDSTGYDIANGDYNKDGVTNSDDAVAILRMLAGYVD